MYFPILTALLAATAFAVPTDLAPRTINTCFENTTNYCLGRQADISEANVAIATACNKISWCIQGNTTHGRTTVTGKATGSQYLATLNVGNDCAGLSSWTPEGCAGLFHTFINTPCQSTYPVSEPKFQRKCATSLRSDGLVGLTKFSGIRACAVRWELCLVQLRWLNLSTCLSDYRRKIL